ncbi:uncharacterized protein LOC141827241 [Curcuma longa]|uniref:uncharacterized protein LOC141827241 n=1 Tax=Curcuma longa TaxID=136217 RepID=UPI003D9F8F7A
MQETQIAQLSSSLSSRQVGALLGKSDFNPMEHCKAIELRSGRILKGKEPQETAPLEGITCMTTAKQPPSSTLIVEDELEEVETATPTEEPSKKTLVRNIPFPQRLMYKQRDDEFEKLYNRVKDITLDIPLLDALVEMPKFAKFIKRLMSTKNITEAKHTVALTEEVSVIIFNNKLPLKLKDPRIFTIPCKIGMILIGRTFCDLGASVSIIPYKIGEKYGYTDLKLTTIVIQLADHFCRYPMGIVEDVSIEVRGFTIPTDFVVLDMEEDLSIPIILGRSFLATAGAKIDIKNHKLSLEVGRKKVKFNLLLDSNAYIPEKERCCRLDDIQPKKKVLYQSITLPMEEPLVPKTVTQLMALEAVRKSTWRGSPVEAKLRQGQLD